MQAVFLVWFLSSISPILSTSPSFPLEELQYFLTAATIPSKGFYLFTLEYHIILLALLQTPFRLWSASFPLRYCLLSTQLNMHGEEEIGTAKSNSSMASSANPSK